MLHMLQADRSRSLAGNEPGWDQGDQEASGIWLATLLASRRQYLLILFVTALMLAASVIYLRMTPPTYTALVKVLFANPKAEYFQQQSILADSPLDRANSKISFRFSSPSGDRHCGDQSARETGRRSRFRCIGTAAAETVLATLRLALRLKAGAQTRSPTG